VLRDLKSAPDTRDLPVIVISGHDLSEGPQVPGALEYFTKPIDRAALTAALRRIDRPPRPEPRRVAVVDDDALVGELFEAMLPRPEYAVTVYTQAPQALDAIRRDPPDAVILDLMMPDLSGQQFLELLRADPLTCDLPVLVVTAKQLSAAEQLHLEATSQTVIKKTNLTRQHIIDALRRLRFSAPSQVARKETVS
jgi:CheY-like chemotaxis protein